jgi:type I restriction enzyme, S subunit
MNLTESDTRAKLIDPKLKESGWEDFVSREHLIAKVTPCFEYGKAGIVRNLENSIGFGSSEYHVIRAKSKMLPEWIYYSLMTSKFREEGVNNMTGSSGLKRVPLKFMEEWKIKAPAIEEQKKTIEKIQAFDKKLKAINSAQQSKLTYLKALKSSLLDRAFKGEL